MPFRSDIAGLRAWAVLLVVAHHFGLPGFAGGFIGVDIFFVLSGWLMAALSGAALRSAPADARFLAGFWLRRALRLLPAMVPLFWAVALWGWFALSPARYAVTASEALRAGSFSLHHYFAQGRGYFDPAVTERLFLHLWSLGVEAGWYLLWPLLVALLWRIWPQQSALSVTVGALAIASFCWMLSQRGGQPAAAFFTLSARAWEPAFGALLWALSAGGARRPAPGLARALEATGFLLILICLFRASPETLWPGPLTLLPVAGAGLILIAGRAQSRLTAPAPLQIIGALSYSWYLWHWPIAVGLRLYGGASHWPSALAAALASLALAGLSWRLIEGPLLHRLRREPPRRQALMLGAGFVAMLAPWALILSQGGFDQRLPAPLRAELARARAALPLPEGCGGKSGARVICQIGSGDPALVLIGDSHGAVMAGALAEALGPGRALMLALRDGCLPAFGARLLRDEDPDRCARFLPAAEAAVARLPEGVPVLFIYRYPLLLEGENAEGEIHARRHARLGPGTDPPDAIFQSEARAALAQGLCRLAGGRPAAALETVPEHPRAALSAVLLRDLAAESQMARADYEARIASSRAMLAQAGALCGLRSLAVADVFCDASHCHTTTPDGTLLYRDDDHLSPRGADLLLAHLGAPIGL